MARLMLDLVLCCLLLLQTQNACRGDIDVSAQEQDLASEIAALKGSIASKDLKESNLLSQLDQIKAEAKKLRKEAKQRSTLETKLEDVEKELEDTKDTLSKTMGQLADRSSSISQSEQKVAEATRKLHEAVEERDEAQKKLQEFKTLSQDADKMKQAVEKERLQRVDLEGKIDELKVKNTELTAQLSQSKKAAEAAEKEVASWQSKAEKAEKNVEKAEKTLEKALQEHTATQSALIQAEAKAEEAMKTVESLLTSWLPHWLQERYQQLLVAAGPALKHVQPTANKLWYQGKGLLAQGKLRAIQGYEISKTKSEKAWRDAKPRLEQTWKATKKHTHVYTKHTIKTLGPYLKQCKLWIAKQYKSGYKSVSRFLDQNSTVMKLRRNSKQTMRELEGLAAKYMKQVPFLKDYAKPPTVTYIVYGVLAAPLITILVPLFALKGNKEKPGKKGGSHRTSAGPGPTASEQNGKGSKSKRARRISVGEEHVRVP